MNDKLKQILEGTAYGDALGNWFEFSDVPSDVDFNLMVKSEKLEVTDDTQLTLFLTQALLDAQGHSSSLADAIAKSYGEWFKTQVDVYTPGYTGLLAFRQLWVRRAPGNTCLGSCAFFSGNVVRSKNTSKGNGTVMRCAPIGVLGAQENLPAIRVAIRAAMDAQMTHDHPLAKQGSVVWTLLHYYATSGVTLGAAIQHVKDFVRTRFSTEEFFKYETLDDNEFELVRNDIGAWVAEEAVAVALRCVLGAKDWLSAVKAAVCIKGDSDTVGSMAGGLAAHYHSLPKLGTLDAQEAIDSLCA